MSVQKVTIERGIAFFEDGTEVSNVSIDLIKASPDLLKFAKWAMKRNYDCPYAFDSVMHIEAEDVIAKAGG